MQRHQFACKSMYMACIGSAKAPVVLLLPPPSSLLPPPCCAALLCSLVCSSLLQCRRVEYMPAVQCRREHRHASAKASVFIGNKCIWRARRACLGGRQYACTDSLCWLSLLALFAGSLLLLSLLALFACSLPALCLLCDRRRRSNFDPRQSQSVCQRAIMSLEARNCSPTVPGVALASLAMYTARKEGVIFLPMCGVCPS